MPQIGHVHYQSVQECVDVPYCPQPPGHLHSEGNMDSYLEWTCDGHDGAGPDGAGPDGAGPDGAGPDGPGPDGAGPDGAGPDGARPDGAAPDV